VNRASLVAALVAAAALVLVPQASAIDDVNTKNLRKQVEVDGILDHERAFQQIAIASDGTRAATTLGYDASVDYVVNRLNRAGYRVRLDEFDFPEWTLNSPSTLRQVTPTDQTFIEDTDYIVSQFSGSAAPGELTAQIVPTNDIEIPLPGEPGSGTSGCEPGDFPATTMGNIALMQRGTCPFVQKYQMAKDAGAVAALIFNDGAGEDREEPLFITSPVNIGIPTIMISNDVGEALYADAQEGATAEIVVDATTTPNTEVNVLADSRDGRRGRTIVVGGHLDSVEEGPGINDNGSGVSTILEVAEEAAKLNKEPRNRLRFAFWGAEEAGLVGSTAYVDELVANGRIDQIEANLNFDMVGSPNFVRFVYDGDLSDSEPPPSGAPPGSAEIEGLFTSYFSSQGLVSDPTAFDGRSDYGPFIENGVAAGGLFTGAEGEKTAAQAAIYGGFAGQAYDPCYHQACDTFDNVSTTALDQMSDATAHATWTLARSDSALVSGARKKAGKAAKATGLPFKGPFPTR
jgi:Zn-dependent M28 family amino/carboxypeptidase